MSRRESNVKGFLFILGFVVLIVSPIQSLAATAYYYMHDQPGYAISWLILTIVLGRYSFRIVAYIFDW
jgi:hypothetical protein